jgi:hypothetical protein
MFALQPSKRAQFVTEHRVGAGGASFEYRLCLQRNRVCYDRLQRCYAMGQCGRTRLQD